MATRAFVMVTLLVFGTNALAIDPLPFKDAAEEARFRALAAELRCVMCQNQSLADSTAPIAQDLRKEVFELMQQGNSDAQIKQFLTERYSEFVLYKPPVQARTFVIWFGPLLVLLGGAVAVVMIVRRRAAGAKHVLPADEDAW